MNFDTSMTDVIIPNENKEEIKKRVIIKTAPTYILGMCLKDLSKANNKNKLIIDSSSKIFVKSNNPTISFLVDENTLKTFKSPEIDRRVDQIKTNCTIFLNCILN